MASFEDYDEFGNYIGADLGSDEEEDVPQGTFSREAQAPLEGFDDEPAEAPEDNALMEVDGALQSMRVTGLFTMYIYNRTNP